MMPCVFSEMFRGEELSKSLVSALKSIEEKIPGQTQIHHSLKCALTSVLSNSKGYVKRGSSSNLFSTNNTRLARGRSSSVYSADSSPREADAEPAIPHIGGDVVVLALHTLATFEGFTGPQLLSFQPQVLSLLNSMQ